MCRRFGIHWDTLNKILGHNAPPGYRLGQPRARRKIGPYLEIIDRIPQQDKNVHRKQRHTKHRIFERLRDEYGYPLGLRGSDGNTNDATTVGRMVEAMESKYGQAERIWVMDRGIPARRERGEPEVPA